MDYVDVNGDSDLMKLFGMSDIGEGKKSNMPKALQPSVSKYTIRQGIETEIRLKNATAFGQPITRIVFEHPETSYAALTVYFTNSSFINLKQKFTVKVNGEKHTLTKNKAWGITVKETNEKDEYGNFRTVNIYTPLSKQQLNKIEQQRKTQGYYVGQFSGIMEINETG